MYTLVRCKNRLEKLKLALDTNEPLFVDTETCTEEGKTKGGLYGQIRLIQVFQEGWESCFIIDCFFVDLHQVLDILKGFHWILHNSSYDLHTINLQTKETYLPKEVDDTVYLSRLHYFTHSKFDFYSCLDYCNESDHLVKGIDKSENQKADWGGPISVKMFYYAAIDVVYLAKLWHHVKHKIDTEVYKLDIVNLKHAIHYDRNGLPICRDTIKILKSEYMVKSEKYLEMLPVNPNSSKQMCAWLGISNADATTLGVLALKGSEEAELALKAKHYTKGLNFIQKYDRDTMYGFHNPCGAITGRMSCNGGDRYDHENTQQPPKYLFPAIKAPKHERIIYKDYSGLELRMAVAFVGEPTMEGMMKKGMDLHTHTGCHLFDCTPETLPELKRTITKFYNFGTIYGAYPKTLRALLRSQGRIEISMQEATDLRNKWLDLYEYFRMWHKMYKKILYVQGYIDITTCLGRVIRAYNLNDALNFPIQGSSVEVTKTAVKLLLERHPEANIINVVHDSMALLQDEDEADLWKDRLNSAMVDAWYYVINDLAIPDLPMPPEAEIKKAWKEKELTYDVEYN